jgi:hypothetical protein
MKLLTGLTFCILAYSAPGQDSTKRWHISTALSFGGENNWGNPGVLLSNAYEYRLNRQLSVSGLLAVFHSLSQLHPDPSNSYGQFSALISGIHLTHTARFKQDKNFVMFCAGIDYITSSSYRRNGYPETEDVNKLGYGLSLEGGGGGSLRKLTWGCC